MNWRLVSRFLGLLSLLIGASMTLSLPWSFPACGQARSFEQATFRGMCMSILACWAVGLLLWLVGRKAKGTVLRKEALAVVGLGWLMCGLLGATPFLLTPTFRLPGIAMSPVDAAFESISGFTTTGASVLTQLEVPPDVSDCEAAALSGQIAYVPRSVLFWRSFTHWLGGMGIIVLFVAILGQLGAGGKAMMRREVPGPLSDNVRPRVRETAVLMWVIYLSLSGILCIALMFAGMHLFDALCHTFGTMATGGFSTSNSSIGGFASAPLELLIIVFMVAAGTNFNLYYALFHKSHTTEVRFPARLKKVARDPELQAYLGIIVMAVAAIAVLLRINASYGSSITCVRHALFNVVSIMTTTGYGTEDYVEWPELSQALLLLLMFVGGSSGSTGGGIKVIRMIVLWRVLRIEAERAFRPNVVRPLRIAGHRIPDEVGRNVLVYMCLIMVIAATSWLWLVGLEPVDQWVDRPPAATGQMMDCASAVAATLNNIGPGFGVCGPAGNYTGFSDAGKCLLTALMLLGRLELYAILVFFVPSFWKNE
jgi:trk/ktr system potassium uptake protein